MATISIPEQSVSKKIEIEITYKKEHLAQKDLLYGKKGASKGFRKSLD